MTGFEPLTSGVGSDHSTNWATTTALTSSFVIFVFSLTTFPYQMFFWMGLPRPLFCFFSFFSNTSFTEKRYASAWFEHGSSERKASTLTIWPHHHGPPYQMFTNVYRSQGSNPGSMASETTTLSVHCPTTNCQVIWVSFGWKKLQVKCSLPSHLSQCKMDTTVKACQKRCRRQQEMEIEFM